MKTIITLFFLQWVAYIQGQTSDKDTMIVPIAEIMPVFPGGQSALKEYLGSVNYPIEAHNNGISRGAYVKFVIEKNGDVTNVSVAKSSGNEILDNAAVAHVKSMPAWEKPALQNGKPVRVLYGVSITFDN